jgi:hypothetical protein
MVTRKMRERGRERKREKEGGRKKGREGERKRASERERPNNKMGTRCTLQRCTPSDLLPPIRPYFLITHSI